MTAMLDEHGQPIREEEEGVEYAWVVDSEGRQRRIPAGEDLPEVPALVLELDPAPAVETPPMPAQARREVLEVILDLAPEPEAPPVPAQAPEEALWPTMPAPAWQYTLAGRCVWAVGAVWLAPLPGAILAGAAAVAGFLPGAEVCAVAAAATPWIAIALHERAARREQPWRAVAGEDGAPVIREAGAGRRFVRGERGGEQRWIPAEVWNWAAPGEVAEGGGLTGRLAGAVRSHLPALLGGQPDSLSLIHI